MSLGERSIAAVFWGAGGTAFRILLQFGSQVVLARILGPTEYGMFAVGGIVVGLCSFFADFGLAYGLIQKREVTDEDMRFAFTWQCIVGLGVAAAIAGSSGLVAHFFGEPRGQAVIAFMALICLANAVAGTSMNLLKRNLDFKTQQFAFLISYVVGFYCVGIPLALTGHGVWSLAIAWVIQASLWGALLYRKVRHPVRPLFWYAGGRTQASYGLTVLRTNVLNWFIGNVDRIVVGRVLPTRDIGLYSTVYTMIYAPSASLLGIVQPVLFSASARVTQDIEASDADAAAAKLVRAFTGLIAVVCLYLLPVFVTAAVLADQFIAAVYGAAWADGAVVLRPVALAMPLLLCVGLSTPVLWASGRPQDEFGKQWLIAIVWALACWPLARVGGIHAVAWGVLGLFSVRFGIVVHALTRASAVRWAHVWRSARGGLAVSVAVAVGVGLADAGLRSLGWPPGVCVLGASLCAVLVFLGSLRLAPALIGQEVSGLMGGVAKRLSPRIAYRIDWLWGAEGRTR